MWRAIKSWCSLVQISVARRHMTQSWSYTNLFFSCTGYSTQNSVRTSHWPTTGTVGLFFLVYFAVIIVMFHITSMLFQLYLKWQTLFKKGKHVLQFQYRMLIIVLLAINGRTCSQSGIPLLIPTVGIPLVGICYLFYVILYTSMICMIMHMVVLMNAFTEYPSKVFVKVSVTTRTKWHHPQAPSHLLVGMVL